MLILKNFHYVFDIALYDLLINHTNHNNHLVK